MPTYNSTYLVSTVGYSGRVPFSSTAVGYFFPLIDTSKISISNSQTGDPTNYDVPSIIPFPLLFYFSATAACRLRRRFLHPACFAATSGKTSETFTYMVTPSVAGYTDVAAGTDAIRNATLGSANVAAGTASLTRRIFNAVNTGVYGSLIPSGTIFPVMVNSLRDCWMQVIARDGDGTASSGSFHFTLASNDDIVGY